MRLFIICAIALIAAAIPAVPYNFTQRVDHFSSNAATFEQRFYMNDTSFGGPGSPIICILGGEGAISPSTGIFYPYVVILAERLSALIIEPEHRFYGTSQPLPAGFDTSHLELLTAPQALADAAAFITATRAARGCAGDPGTSTYCPVITIGGSYPGWLSAMMRLRYPAVVDMAWAASAPMKFYSQEVAAEEYYASVTASAQRASPSCPDAVRAVLAATLASGATKDVIASNLGLCEPLPAYITAGDASLLVDEVSMVFAYTWANMQMANYPPTADTALARACALFDASNESNAWATLAAFFAGYASTRRRGGVEHASLPASSAPCYNLSAQLPSGPRATISSGDWSGVGSGDGGSAWDFETCTLLVEAIGMTNTTDMFLPRAWSLAWLNAHCQARFGVSPAPRELVDLWGFDAARLPAIASRIVFTNGLNDGWSVGGIKTNLSDTLLAWNAPNGAHHSDLSHNWPGPDDTPDVAGMRESVAQTFESWLADISVPLRKSKL